MTAPTDPRPESETCEKCGNHRCCGPDDPRCCRRLDDGPLLPRNRGKEKR